MLLASILLGLPDELDPDNSDDLEEWIHSLMDDLELPLDAIGQLCWRFPALRDSALFQAAFGMSIPNAAIAVRRARTMGLPDVLFDNIWTLAMLLADALATLGSERRVDDWLAGRRDPLDCPALVYLENPIGRDMIRAALYDVRELE
jgi:hypothetical protein